MYFSKITFKTDVSPTKWWIIENLYQTHRTIWKLFPDKDQQNRDFLYREISTPDNLPCYYVVSPDLPEDKDGYWTIETKPYQPNVQIGQRFQFSLRVNPVITKTDKTTGRKSRHDVVMNGKKEWLQTYGQYPTGSDSQLLVAESGYQWLTSRAEKNGFSLEKSNFSVPSYLQHRINKKAKKADFKKNQDQKKDGTRVEIRFSTLDLEGVLTVINPNAFHRCLVNGLGPAKSFGCGLLMIKPVRE